ncbi:virulence protein E [Paenibacillus albicereus]|uniref:Virulence protein E n=1 Tax=Paenibacillus albicereus TaxID=2726185 RepID=A0A6H2H094_9BACL|nr:virulence-associated E family protein [Paenibacillus albicereus]QJC53072.1 virulence protein E [Paenibacillus albicereus]
MQDIELDISFGKHRADVSWKPEYLTWAEFVERLQRVRRTAETMAQYDKMSNAERGKVKDGPAFVGGLVRGGRRKKENVDTRSLITLDIDRADDSFLFSVELVLGGTAYAIYSTHSHRPAAPKYRLIAPCSRPLSPDEYAAVARKLAEQIGMEYMDKTTFDVHRLMYLPSCSKDAEPELHLADGGLLDVDAVLAMYADWRDVMAWPRHAGDKAPALAAKRAQDPREKQGTIGLFCRTFTIEEGIDTFLADVYSPGSMPNRYTYAGGSSANGLEIYPEQDLAFSHQDSDPAADGRTYNLFDLVRVHKFGQLDERVKEHTPDAKKPSHLAMEHFVAARPEIKRAKMAEIQEAFGDIDAEPAAGDPEPDEDDAWVEQLETHHKTGAPLPTAGNVELLLSNGPWKGVLAYDAFGNTEVIRKALPWRGRLRPQDRYEPWLGEDDDRRDHWFDKLHKIRSAQTIKKAFTEVTRRNKFHPIIDYLEAQEWDGQPRLDRLFVDYLGAMDTAYVREATRKMFVAAVKRLYDPGCKFDYMLVLVGPQGANKSTIVQMMAQRWFSDSLKSFDTKEAGEHLQSAWIFEFGELAGMSKTEVDEIKQFITKRSDKYRVAYDRVITDFPRKCVFFGTTNNWNFLKDPTGNRRFWPVTVDPEKRTKNVFEQLTDGEIGQIWAEALRAFRAGESLEFSPEVDAEAKKIQGLHMEDDPRVGLIQEWLETEEADELERPTGQTRQRVCANQIWVECLGKRKGDMRPWEAREICDIMRRIPGWREVKGRVRVPGYGQQTAFDRCS